MELLLGIFFFFVLLYYGLKLFLKYGLPWLITRFMKNQQSKYSAYGQSRADQQKREGEIKIKTSRQGKPKDDTGFGEYVDFEELDDKD